MIKKHFSISEAINEGWRIYKRNAVIFSAITIFLMIISAGFTKITAGQSGAVTRGGLSLVSGLLQVFIAFGLLTLALSAVTGKKVVWNDLFGSAHLFLKYLGSSICYGIAVAIGFIPMFFVMKNMVLQGIIYGTPPDFSSVAVLPIIAFVFAIIWYIVIAVKYQFYSLILIEKNPKFFSLFSLSAKVTKGVRLKLFAFFILIIFANIFAATLFFGVALIVTAPLSILSITSVYRKLVLFGESNEALARIDPATAMTVPK